MLRVNMSINILAMVHHPAESIDNATVVATNESDVGCPPILSIAFCSLFYFLEFGILATEI